MQALYLQVTNAHAVECDIEAKECCSIVLEAALLKLAVKHILI